MAKELSYMVHSFIRDFQIADDFATEIEVGARELSFLSIIRLDNLIEKTCKDIGIMDKETKKALDLKIGGLDNINVDNKSELEQQLSKDVEDSYDEDSFKLAKLEEDFKCCKEKMVVIKDLSFKRGWFD